MIVVAVCGETLAITDDHPNKGTVSYTVFFELKHIPCESVVEVEVCFGIIAEAH